MVSIEPARDMILHLTAQAVSDFGLSTSGFGL